MANPLLVLILLDHSIQRAESLVVPDHLVAALQQADGLFLGRNDLDYPEYVHLALNELLRYSVTQAPTGAPRGVPTVTVTVNSADLLPPT